MCYLEGFLFWHNYTVVSAILWKCFYVCTYNSLYQQVLQIECQNMLFVPSLQQNIL